MCGRLASTCRRWQLLFNILHEEEAGSPVSRVNNSVVKLRLTLFLNIFSQISAAEDWWIFPTESWRVYGVS